MAETAIEGGPPAVPSNDTEIKHIPETRDSREKVLGVFNSAFSLLENTPEDQLSEAEKWAKQAIKAAKEKTIDQGKDTFTNTFENRDTREAFSQEEGIPIEDLLEFLDKKLKSLPPDSLERQEIINLGHILYRNSQPFSRLPHRREPSRFTARVQQEAYFISQDNRATGNEQDDWLKAEVTLNKRYELIIPPATPELPAETLVTGLTPGPTISPTEVASPVPKGSPVVAETPPSVDTSEPKPPTLEQIRREFVITNRTVDIRKRAAELAEEQLREEMRRGSAWNPLNWPRKIGLRITEEFQRQRYIERATRAMIDNNNSYLTMDVVRNAAVDATHRLAEERAAGKAKIEQVKTGEALEGQQVVEAPGPLRDMMINEIIRPIIDGTITNEGEIQQRLRDFVRAHETEPQIQAVFGRDATQYGRLAEYFATDLLETGELIRQDLASHRYALEQINEVVRIQLANTHWAAETQASFRAVDKATAWVLKRFGGRAGILANPAFIGATFSLGTFGLIRATGVGARAAQVLVPGAGLLPGALFAAARRSYDLKVDMAAHQVERAYARQVPQGARRREALERFAYNTASVGDLLSGGGEEVLTGTQRESLQTLLGRDLSIGQTTNQENVVRRIAEIKARLDFSAREKVDLVTFAGREEVEQGRLGLIKAVVGARQALRNAGMPETEIADLEKRFTGEWNQRFIQNREQQDRAFAGYRARQALVAGAFGGAAGLAGGLVGQEAVAGLSRLTGHVVGETVLEKGIHGVAGLFGHPEAAVPIPSLSTEVFQNLYQSSGGSVEVSSSLAATVNPDHSLVFIDTTTGQPVPDLPKITLGPDGHMNVTGGIPSDLRDQLEQSGFKIDQGPNIEEPGRTIVEQRSVLGPDGEWTNHATHVNNRQWYSYDEPYSQGNELHEYTFKAGKTVTVDMSTMELGYQRGLVPNPIDVQEVIRNGEAGVYITLGDNQQNGIWVPDFADGVIDGKVRFDPDDVTHMIQTPSGPISNAEVAKMVINQEALRNLPDGNIATELRGHQDVFNLNHGGKPGFIEAGRLVQRPEGNVLQAFATIRGASPIPETVGVPVETLAKTTPTFEITPPPPPEIPITPEAPPIIPLPFAPRHPLERLGIYPPPGLPYYYGAEYPPEWIQQAREGFSPGLRQNSNYIPNPSVDIPWYINRQKQNQEYFGQLENLESQVQEPMNRNCEMAVCIAVAGHQEQANIYRTLQTLEAQTDTNGRSVWDSDKYEVILLVNWPQGSSPKATLDEINRFGADYKAKTGKDFPLRVYQHEVTNGLKELGLYKKMAFDLALQRRQQTAPGQEIYITMNDADMTYSNPHSLDRMLSIIKNPRYQQFDAVLGRQDLDPEAYHQYPTFHAGMRFWQFMESTMRSKLGMIGTQGRNTVIKGSSYAAIGGNRTKDFFADIEFGDLFKLARNNQGSILYSNANWVMVDPRREISKFLSGEPIAETWFDFNTRNVGGTQINFGDYEDVDIDKLQTDQETISKFNQRLEKEFTRIAQIFGPKIEKDPSLKSEYATRLGLEPDATIKQILERSLALLGAQGTVDMSGQELRITLSNTEKLRISLKTYRDELRKNTKIKTNPLFTAQPVATQPASPQQQTTTETLVAEAQIPTETTLAAEMATPTPRAEAARTLTSEEEAVIERLLAPAREGINQIIDDFKRKTGKTLTEDEVRMRLRTEGLPLPVEPPAFPTEPLHAGAPAPTGAAAGVPPAAEARVVSPEAEVVTTPAVLPAIQRQAWNNMSEDERREATRQRGLPEEIYNQAWSNLTEAQRQILSGGTV